MSDQDASTRQRVLLSAIGPSIALVGVLIGALVTNLIVRLNNEALYRLQHQTEMRERSYSRLMGLKIATSQTVFSYLDARLGVELYYAEFRNSQKAEAFSRTKEERDRAESLLIRLTDLHRQTFETLGEVRIAYGNDQALLTKMQPLYKFCALRIERPRPEGLNSPEALLNAEIKAKAKINNYVQETFDRPFDDLLSVLSERQASAK